MIRIHELHEATKLTVKDLHRCQACSVPAMFKDIAAKFREDGPHKPCFVFRIPEPVAQDMVEPVQYPGDCSGGVNGGQFNDAGITAM